MTAVATRKRIQVRGTVQGVGFRPFVYRIAQHFDVRGFVLNSSEGVVIEAESEESALDRFLTALERELPPLAKIDELKISDIEPRGDERFAIHHSLPAAGQFVLVPPDVATCDDCRRELLSPRDRRHAYPFTNCTNCGPRYTIIRDIPYDRPKTTMDEFPLCPRCQAEYEDPANRRFHAEPNACPDCGPGLALVTGEQLESGVPSRFATGAEGSAVLERTRRLLRQGEIVAIKGLGGFHLACDASNERAVDLLRDRKRRSGKAFAIMARDLETVERLCYVSAGERALLLSPRQPIVLLHRREAVPIAAGVAPGNKRLGVMLPYTPLHQLLFDGAPGFDALVMTSGNLSEEPIVCANAEAWPRLHDLADHFLLHNRRIQTRVDDSVVQTFEDREYPVRRSRGYAPEPIDLGMPMREILACGGELKNTLCLTKQHYAILSQHIGDLENVETMEFFRETLGHLERFFRVSPVAAAYDLHPNYLSTRFALEESGLPAIGVQHHHAHIASCMADNGLREPVIGVALDGTGYGTDGQIWGGEFLVCDFGGFARRAHLRYVPLPGGDSAIRQPWRSALAHLRATFGSRAASLPLPLFETIPPKQIAVVDAMLERGIQTISTSSCGRLFDAVASILGIRHDSTYEGQAAIELEMTASEDQRTYPFELTAGDPMEIDTRSLIESIVHDVLAGADTAAISARFHRTMGRIVAETCARIRERDGFDRVCLSGGTFQNLRLLAHSVSDLRQSGFEVYVHHRVPPNDGGLSLGQAVVANYFFGA
jgi:hydrogenase maturation protein HypF